MNSRGKAFRMLSFAAVFYSSLLMLGGIYSAHNLLTDTRSYNEWQDYSTCGLLIVFLPTVLLGLKNAQLAMVLLFAEAILCVAQVVGISGRTGDGSAAGLVGFLAIVGVPMLLSALLFRWASRSTRLEGAA